MPIRILPSVLINQIAAGEVIERPASAVKELVENALDAGASRIDITIANAGKTLIRIDDNGSGMRKEELPLALERHATSKLPNDDLLAIRHLGFRGEALPSIASVSRLHITSRTSDAAEAWSVTAEAGQVGKVFPAARAVGTTVEVRDLFYATPARLKFMRSDRTELEQVKDIITRLAMAAPSVAFHLQTEEKVLLSIAQHQLSLIDATRRRLGEILGSAFEQNCLSIERKRDGIMLTGYISLPTLNRGTSSELYFFVNGRPVRDRLLIGTVKAAYQDFLAHDRYPIVALYLQLPGEEVDVNVHPAKTEVRFRDSGSIRSLIISSLKSALAGSGHRASTTVASQALQVLQSSLALHVAPVADLATLDATFYHAVHESARQPTYSAPLAAPTFVTPEEPQIDPPLGYARAQLHQTYIVAQTMEGIVLVDQHAAHERLVYERMKAGLESRGMPSQPLLLPEVVQLDEKSATALLARREELAMLGLVIDGFGEGTIIVRETPALLGDIDADALLHDLCDDIEEWGEALTLKARLEHFCGTLACHTSVRAGRILSIPEMNALLRQMEATPHSGQCNHGRPTYVELKLHDIERLFGRKK